MYKPENGDIWRSNDGGHYLTVDSESYLGAQSGAPYFHVSVSNWEGWTATTLSEEHLLGGYHIRVRGAVTLQERESRVGNDGVATVENT